MDVARTFVAIAPGEALRERLAALAGALRSRFAQDSVRWGEPANYHITLVFLGRTVLADLPRIQARLASVASSLAAFRYRLQVVRPFPDARAPRVIAALPADESGFALWQQSVAAALAAEGFAPETRPYRPHLSLGRCKGPALAPFTQELAVDLEGTAAQLLLYESRGGRYLPLCALPCMGLPSGV